MDRSEYSWYQANFDLSQFSQVDFKWATRLNRLSLQFVGLWPKTERKFLMRLLYHLHEFVVFLLLVFGILLPYTLSLLTIHDDVALMIEHLQFISPITSCIIKFVIFWRKKEAVTPMVDMIAKDWRDTRTARERSVMIAWARKARAVVIIVYTVMTAVCSCLVFLPAFGISITYLANNTGSGRVLPLQSYDIYDATRRPLYELTYVGQTMAIVSAGMAYTAIDTFLGLLVFHICGQLDILGTRIMNLAGFTRYCDRMRDCVVNHIRLLRAIDVIEDIYNIMLLAIFLNFAFLFAAYGFLIVTLLEERDNASIMRLMFFIFNVLNIFMHVSLYCAVGEMLVAKCDKLHYAVYNQKWYIMDPKGAKGLILIMIKSEEPSYITAGKVFPMTMVTLCNLLKTSAGYISVLLTTRN